MTELFVFSSAGREVKPRRFFMEITVAMQMRLSMHRNTALT
jgi:hypothetical protein